MNANQAAIATFALILISLSGPEFQPASNGLVAGPAPAQSAGQPAVARRMGAIKTINGNLITLTPDSGPDVSVTVQPNARILSIAPGEKDLKNATPVQLQALQVGDRVRVRGQASADGNSIAALEVIVIPHSDLEARHEQERQDWQKRGLGGLVSAVDPATGTVTISVTGLGGKKEIAVHTSTSTVFRRYAPDSVKFDDAKPSTLAGHPAGRPAAGAGRSQRRGFRVDGARNCHRRLSQCCRLGEFCRCQWRHPHRSGFIEQEAGAGKDFIGLATPQTAARDGTAHRHAIEGVDAPGNAGSGRRFEFSCFELRVGARCKRHAIRRSGKRRDTERRSNAPGRRS